MNNRESGVSGQDSMVKGRKSGQIGPRLLLFLFLASSMLNAGFCMVTPASCAETTIRVLLLDTKFSGVPQKDEKVEKLGLTKGDVLLSGLKYSGALEVWKGEKGLYIVNEIPLEEYIRGVVASEVGRSWDLEALKAQAVVARTYAIYQKMNIGAQKVRYHLTSSVLHQIYRGGAVPEAIARAVNETRGEILTFEDKPIIAYYHSTSDGMTEDPAEVFGKSYPYLRPVETNCELSPYCVWERRIPCSEIERAVSISGIRDIGIDSYTVSQRAKNVRILSEMGLYDVLAKDLRKSLGWERLPSTMITSIRRDGETFVIEGKGYGHGVGMCQWTALQMAKSGMKYREILSKFYPGTTLEIYEDR